MTEGLAPTEPTLRLSASLLVLLGVAQLGLIVAVFSRVVDPGWSAYGGIGTLAGLGVAFGCSLALASVRARREVIFRTVSVFGVLGGLVYSGAWLSLLGGIFWLDDVPRIAALVAADLSVAGWFVLAAVTVKRPRPPGLLGVGVYLSIRAIVEARYLAGIIVPGPPRNPGSSPGLEGIFLGVLVLSGIVLLALWELAFARWIIERSRGSRAGWS